MSVNVLAISIRAELVSGVSISGMLRKEEGLHSSIVLLDTDTPVLGAVLGNWV